MPVNSLIGILIWPGTPSDVLNPDPATEPCGVRRKGSGTPAGGPGGTPNLQKGGEERTIRRVEQNTGYQQFLLEIE